jgi:aspartyl-tRNA(Asn)/glutamyl-tRNA(Gln) amidotransferase subunit B
LVSEDPARWDPITGCVDYNRSGFPLVEIVTEPDFKSINELRSWLTNLVTTLSYINALDKEAGIKSDVNISVAPKFQRVEIKNVNSFTSIIMAAEYEVERQEKLEKEGKVILQETRAWDDSSETTKFMRSKENAQDYMFIPDPDLPMIKIEDSLIDSIQKILPEKPHEKKERYIKKLKLDNEDAYVLSSNIYLAEIFEDALKHKIEPRIAVRWLRRELLRVANYQKKDIEELPVTKENLLDLMSLVQEKKITDNVAQKIIEQLSEKSFNVKKHIKDMKLEAVSDTGELERLCRQAIDENPKAVADYLGGKEQALNFVMGRVMRKSGGKATPNTVIGLLKKIIKK